MTTDSNCLSCAGSKRDIYANCAYFILKIIIYRCLSGYFDVNVVDC